MPIQILMPALSSSMSEGNIARWLKKEGDEVKVGDLLAEIETDKATIEFEAADQGRLAKILVPDGSQGVQVGQPIAVLLADGEDTGSLAAAPTTVKADSIVKAPSAVAPPHHHGETRRIAASPLARRIARDGGVDLNTLTGSGPHGRILRHDVEEAMAKGVARPPAAQPQPVKAEASAAPASAQAFTELPLSAMRTVIARRLTESKQNVPHFYLSIDCRMDELLALRSELNNRSNQYKLSVNDFVVRAVALALRRVPAANASFTETAIRLYRDVDISVAVATANGLITPIIRHADRKGLAHISAEMKELATKARGGKLKPEEFQGGGFTISNLGMYGVRDFAAIINPPQGCILAVGAGEQRPVVKDGALAIATVMSCTLSVDHRVVDGAVGAEFLAAFKMLIEQPLTMLL